MKELKFLSLVLVLLLDAFLFASCESSHIKDSVKTAIQNQAYDCVQVGAIMQKNVNPKQDDIIFKTKFRLDYTYSVPTGTYGKNIDHYTKEESPYFLLPIVKWKVTEIQMSNPVKRIDIASGLELKGGTFNFDYFAEDVTPYESYPRYNGFFGERQEHYSKGMTEVCNGLYSILPNGEVRLEMRNGYFKNAVYQNQIGSFLRPYHEVTYVRGPVSADIADYDNAPQGDNYDSYVRIDLSRKLKEKQESERPKPKDSEVNDVKVVIKKE